MTYEIKIAPLSDRRALIQNRVDNSSEVGETIYDFRGGTYTPKVISLSIKTPVYRMENCRTFTDQQNDIALKQLDKNYFAKGQELSTVQLAQHLILTKLAKRGTPSVTPIIDVLAEDGPREEILITSTGVVVNGNRRLAAMRELLRKGDGSIDGRFTHVKCAVLPPDTTPDEIDDIEANLQARPQTKLDYDWIGEARLVRRQVNKGRTTKEVADQLRRTKADVENMIQSLDEADLYLSNWVKKPGQYALISGDAEQIFADIPKRIFGQDAKLQDASRAIAWSLYDNRGELPGRLYSFNAAFGKLAPEVLNILAEQLDIDLVNSADDDSGDDDFVVEIREDAGPDYTLIIAALQNEETKEDTVAALIDACETAIERQSGQKSEKAALKALSQAHAKIASIEISGAGASTLPAIGKQLESILNVVGKLQKKLLERQEVSEKHKAD